MSQLLKFGFVKSEKGVTVHLVNPSKAALADALILMALHNKEHSL